MDAKTKMEVGRDLDILFGVCLTQAVKDAKRDAEIREYSNGRVMGLIHAYCTLSLISSDTFIGLVFVDSREGY